VHRETNPRFHALLTAFKQRTGCPVLVNTSLNVRSDTDRMHAGGCIPLFHGHRDRPSRQLPAPQSRTRPLKQDYRDEFEPD
jgi:carbamoyltransferase